MASYWIETFSPLVVAPFTTVAAFAIAGHSLRTPSSFTGRSLSIASKRRPSAVTSTAAPPPSSVWIPWVAMYAAKSGSPSFGAFAPPVDSAAPPPHATRTRTTSGVRRRMSAP